MNRRRFVNIGCSCMTAPWVARLMSSCNATHYVSGSMESTGISVPRTEFIVTSGTKTTLRDYVIVRNESMEYPICLYRFSDSAYAALLMKCTHQGTELQAAGDHLHCPGHGSEFNSMGKVTQGPAEEPLRTFQVLVDKEKLLIALK